MTTLTLAEEVMLLSLDDDSGASKDQSNVAWATAGAVLVELTLAGRVEVGDDRAVVVDPAPLGVPYLDAELAALAERGPSHKVKNCLQAAHKGAADGATQALVDRGLLREEKKKILGLFPSSRYPEADGSAEQDLRRRLDRVVVQGSDPDERTAALVALLHGARLQKLAFPTGDKKQIADRMARIADGQWVQPAVRKAIDQAQAVMAAIVVTAATTTTMGATGG